MTTNPSSAADIVALITWLDQRPDGTPPGDWMVTCPQFRDLAVDPVRALTLIGAFTVMTHRMLQRMAGPDGVAEVLRRDGIAAAGEAR